MTLYILDTNLKKKCIIYVIATILCMIFSFIYLKFSFGVVSIYMKYVFVLPLVLGFGIYLLLLLINNVKLDKLPNDLYDAGVLTFIFGSIVRGILDICGAHSFLLWIYVALGTSLILLSIIRTICFNIKINTAKKLTP